MKAIVKNPSHTKRKPSGVPRHKKTVNALSARQLAYIKQLSRTLLSGGDEFTVKLTRHDVMMLEGILKRG
jgi:hypothetical protein